MKNDEENNSEAQILRKNAEKQLKAKQKKTVIGENEVDVKKLLHELQVHQIELEMQNAALKQANETAESALKKYTMLYDFAPMGYFTLNSFGTICDLNFTGAELLAKRRISLIDSSFKVFVSEDSLILFNQFLIKVFVGNSKECCQVKLVTDENPQCRVYMEGIVLGEDQNCLLSVVDISAFTKG